MYMSSSKRSRTTHSTTTPKDTISQREAYYKASIKKLNQVYVTEFKRLSEKYKQSPNRKVEYQIKYNAEEYLRKKQKFKQYFLGDRDGDVYMFGMGEDGQLGFPDLLTEPTEEEIREEEEKEKAGGEDYDPYGDVEEIKIEIPRKLIVPNVNFTHISVGSLTTVAITDKGQVYGWGCAHGHCLGVDPGPGYVNQPRLLTNKDGLDYRNNHYIQAHVGGAYTLVVSCQGNVFATGNMPDLNTKEYKVCTTSSNEPLIGCNTRFTKMTCFGEGTIQSVNGGNQFAVALSNDGKLYSWGISDADIGFLARPVDKDVRDDKTGLINMDVLREHLTPKEVQWEGDRQHVESFACGANHMLAITSKRQLYSVGLNTDGQLGVGDTKHRHKFTMIETFKKYHILKASAGTFHSVCSDVHGRLFTWGRGDGGRLGLPELADPNCVGMHVRTPAQIFLPNNEVPTNISCGDNDTKVTTNEGNLYFWGYNIDEDATLPKKVKFDDDVFVMNVSAGSQHTAVIATHKTIN